MEKEVILVDPHWRDEKKFGPSLGLSYIGAELFQHSRQPTVVDFITPPVSNQELFAQYEDSFRQKILQVIADHPYSAIVGITCTNISYPRALRIATDCKMHYPETTVVLGGPHITSMHHTAYWQNQPFSDSADVDVLAIGEGESTMRELVLDAPIETIEGIRYRRKDQIITNPTRKPNPNISGAAFPEWSLWDIEKYPPLLPLTTSRGCSQKCTFCDERLIWGNKYRHRTPRNILDEILHNNDVYNIKHVKFADSSLTLHPLLGELCDLLIKSGLKIRWTCFAKVNQVNKDLLRKMKAAGCEMIMFGIESGSQRILQLMRKGIVLDDVRKAVSLCREVGIATEGSFIIGFPTETREESHATIDFAEELGCDSCHWHTFFPSVEMLNNPERWGIPFRDLIDWRTFDLDRPIPLIASDIETNPQLIIDRHAATFLIEHSYPIPKNTDRFSYRDSLSIGEICELIHMAIEMTVSTGSSVSMNRGYEVLGT